MLVTHVLRKCRNLVNAKQIISLAAAFDGENKTILYRNRKVSLKVNKTNFEIGSFAKRQTVIDNHKRRQ
jgi:hypothetical protein